MSWGERLPTANRDIAKHYMRDHDVLRF